jgi:hypothetical protein
VTVEPPWEVRDDAEQARDESKPEKPLGPSGAILRVSHRHEAMYIGIFGKQIISVLAVVISAQPYPTDSPYFPQQKSKTYQGIREWLPSCLIMRVGPLCYFGGMRGGYGRIYNAGSKAANIR